MPIRPGPGVRLGLRRRHFASGTELARESATVWRRRSKTPHGLSAFLAEGSELEGSCRFTGVAMVSGRISGDSVSAETLIVGEQGCLAAAIHAQVLVVHGAVTGSIVATQRVELTRTARVAGDIETPSLAMEEGAVLDGRCRMATERADRQPAGVVVPLTR